MTLEYLAALVREWEGGGMDADDLARKLREYVREEQEIKEQEAKERKHALGR